MESLEQRVRRIEDHVAIYQLVSGYGPLADAGDAGHAASLWCSDGVFDIDLGVYRGREGVAAFLNSPLAVGLRERGSAHVLTQPHIVIDEDRAVATSYSLTLEREESAFRVFRSVAVRWELCRGAAGGWKVHRRLNRVLDGSADARELLAAANAPEPFEFSDPA